MIHTLLLTADDPAACTCEDVHASEDGSHGTSHHSVEPELVIQLLAWQRGTAQRSARQGRKAMSVTKPLHALATF